MGQIIRTDAIVLRNLMFRETSMIVSMLTRDKGKISVLAKGARLPKSQFGATLQPMSHIQAIYYYKPTRDLQTLSETSHLTVFNHVNEDLDRISIGFRMIELVNALLQVDEENEQVFNLLLISLQKLNEGEGWIQNIWPFFQLRLAGILGFQPAIERETVASISEDGGFLLLNSGAILPLGELVPHARKASRTALRAFAIFCRASVDDILRMSMKTRTGHEVATLIDNYMRFHLEDALPTRSHKVIGQLRDPRVEGN